MAQPSFPAGTRDRRIMLQRAIRQANALGEPVESWADLANVWAMKIETLGQETLRALAEEGIDQHQFQILWSRNVADLSPADRLLYGGKVFNIKNVQEIGRKRGLLIIAWAPADQAPAAPSQAT